jgi:hypothetical protein
MTLSVDQVERVRDHVDQNRLQIKTLRDDLVDDLCCRVEAKLMDGKTFDVSLEEAVRELAPDGLQQLEYETILLLDSKNNLMKKFMYVIGLLSAMGISLGMTFRIEHLPGGWEILNYSFLTFGFVFLPLVVYNSYRSPDQRSTLEHWRMLLGFLSGIVTSVAVLFKTLHLPGADMLLLIGVVIFSFTFLPVLFYSLYKKSLSIAQQ